MFKLCLTTNNALGIFSRRKNEDLQLFNLKVKAMHQFLKQNKNGKHTIICAIKTFKCLLDAYNFFF